MKVFGNRVLIEQRVVVKDSAVLLPGGKKAELKKEVSFTVIQIGDEVKYVQVGDIPIFGKHVDFHGIKVVENIKNGNNSTEVLHVIVFEDDILGSDDPATPPVVIPEDATEEGKELLN